MSHADLYTTGAVDQRIAGFALVLDGPQAALHTAMWPQTLRAARQQVRPWEREETDRQARTVRGNCVLASFSTSVCISLSG